MATEENDTTLMCISGDFNAKRLLWNGKSPENTAALKLCHSLGLLNACKNQPGYPMTDQPGVSSTCSASTDRI